MGLCFSSSTSSCASSELSIENCDTLKSYKVDPGKLLCLPLLRDKKKSISRNHAIENIILKTIN